jgi:hypothetical protein
MTFPAVLQEGSVKNLGKSFIKMVAFFFVKLSESHSWELRLAAQRLRSPGRMEY